MTTIDLAIWALFILVVVLLGVIIVIINIVLNERNYE